MTTTDLAAALLRDVKPVCTYENMDPPRQTVWLDEVLAALTAALDGVDERAGEVVGNLRNPRCKPNPHTTADLITDLLAQNAALRAERDDAVNKAKKNARIAAKAYTIITLASDDLQDEGDRVYLGSTNTADILRDAREEWAAHRIIGDSVLTIVEENRVLKTRTEAAEAKVEKLRGAGSNLVAQLYRMWTDARDHRDMGDLGSAEYAKRDMVASALRDAYRTARAALTTEADNG